MADVVNTNQFKTGMAIEIDGQPFTIVEFQHVKPGKGGAFVRTKVRNIATGAVLDKTFRAGEKFDRMHTQSRKVAYLYSTDDEVVLMDNETYEQVSVTPAMAQDALKWVVENMEVELMYLNGQPFEVAAPNFVELTITQSDPGVQGNTAQGATKPATLESGVTIQVPLFIEEGEKVKVDTRTGEYLGRA
jgi:elongation factor P